MDSILTSIKKNIGATEEYTHFDTDIIMHTNTIFAILNQLGVGPVDGFTIHDKSAVWSDYIGDDKLLESVKTYIFLRVKLIFDPPQSSTVIQTMKEQISELEWRLTVHAD